MLILWIKNLSLKEIGLITCPKWHTNNQLNQDLNSDQRNPRVRGLATAQESQEEAGQSY